MGSRIARPITPSRCSVPYRSRRAMRDEDANYVFAITL